MKFHLFQMKFSVPLFDKVFLFLGFNCHISYRQLRIPKKRVFGFNKHAVCLLLLLGCLRFDILAPQWIIVIVNVSPTKGVKLDSQRPSNDGNYSPVF